MNKLKEDGFYLIDSLKEPFEENYTSSQKVKLIKEKQVDLLIRIKNLMNEKTKVILSSNSCLQSKSSFFY